MDKTEELRKQNSSYLVLREGERIEKWLMQQLHLSVCRCISYTKADWLRSWIRHSIIVI